MIDFLKKDKLPKGLNRFLKPRLEFAEKTKVLFLSAFRQKFGVRASKPSGLLIVARFIVPVLAVFSIANIGAAYADSQNVAATSPLYPLKRYVESVKLVLADKYSRPKLELEFASRRAEEIKDLELLADEDSDKSDELDTKEMENEEKEIKNGGKDSKPKSKKKASYENKIHNLADDLEKKLDRSIEETDLEDYPKAKSSELCEPLNSIVQSQSPEVDALIEKRPKVIDRFQRCWDQANENEDNNSKSEIKSQKTKGRKEK